MTVEQFKGHNILVIGEGEKFPLKLGVGKAKKILANLELVKEFVAQYDKPKGG